jgi:hypothetical protein
MNIYGQVGWRAAANVNPSSGQDADALAFITAATITNTTQQNAINTLVTDLKTYGIWAKMKALYPFVGGTAAQHRFNLKDPRTINAAFYLEFNGGGTHSATGYQPNGTTSYANTWLFPSNTLNVSSAHMSFYSRTNSDALCDMGVSSTSNSNTFAILAKYTNKFYSAMGNTTLPTVDNTNGTGMYVSNRNSSTNTTGYKNGTRVLDIAQTGGLPTALLFIGVLSYNNIPLSGNFGNKECAFASIGDGLTDTEATNFYTAVQKYQTTLGRNV